MNKNFKILFFSFLFAAALWFYINLNQSYSLDITIPVAVQYSKSQALTEKIPDEIDVTVKGKGWDLLNILISKKPVYNLDVSKFKKDSRILTDQFVSEGLNLNPNITVVKINPDTININIDKLSEKSVPVKNNIIVNTKEGYEIVGKPELNPDSVTITGSTSIINKIKSVPTETKIFSNVNSDISGVINIKDTLQNLVKADLRQISFTYHIQLSAEKNFDELDVKVVNIPEDKEVLLIPPKVNLSLRGGVDRLAQIGASDIEVAIEFENIESDTLGFVLPEVKLPDETTLLKIDPQKLQYIIKKKR